MLSLLARLLRRTADAIDQPSFARGGYIPGPSRDDDRIPVRLSSGYYIADWERDAIEREYAECEPECRECGLPRMAHTMQTLEFSGVRLHRYEQV